MRSLRDRDRAAMLRRIATLADDDFAAIEAHARIRRQARGELFLRPGDVAIECGTILRRLIRVYFLLADGREVNAGSLGPTTTWAR